jgi:anti-sigma regulatory factor (Ser/Thr protein kinase)
MTAVRRFRCQPGAVSAARGFVRDVLSDHPEPVTDAAELMASELTANAVRHARTDFELAIRSDSLIRVEVSDCGPGEPTLLSPSREEVAGRGLQIVQALSDEWGVNRAEGGKTVWFTLKPAAR